MRLDSKCWENDEGISEIRSIKLINESNGFWRALDALCMSTYSLTKPLPFFVGHSVFLQDGSEMWVTRKSSS